MKTAAKQYAVTFVLACALALLATPSTRAGVRGAGTLAQYCAPPQYDLYDLHRVYCRDRG
jgi:hypothetical protein